MPYYHDLITDQSWHELTQLQTYIPFVLIGGWATYLYAKSLKSKDIDIVIDADMLFALKMITLAERGRSPKGRKTGSC